mgnify:CR=1 FL=1
MIAALKMNSFFVILVVLVQSAAHGFSQMEFTIGLFDGGRNRVVPVTVYQTERESSERKAFSIMAITETGTSNPARHIPI